MIAISEKDWKIIRSMKDRILNLACCRIMSNVSMIIENDKDNAHAKYLELWEMLTNEDNNIALMFDDLKRSNAITKLAKWKMHDLITDEEMLQFSKETQEKVRILIKE